MLLGDHTHVVKDGGRMPGVVSLRETSETQHRPSYFRGQYWGALGLVVGSLAGCFCLPLELTLSGRSSALRLLTLQCNFNKAPLSRLQASLTFRLPRSLDPRLHPPPCKSLTRGGRAVYTTHSSVGYLLRDVVSLRPKPRHGLSSSSQHPDPIPTPHL